VHFVSETAQVELKRGRVYAPAREAVHLGERGSDLVDRVIVTRVVVTEDAHDADGIVVACRGDARRVHGEAAQVEFESKL
jgi:hypothetical protein